MRPTIKQVKEDLNQAIQNRKADMATLENKLEHRINDLETKLDGFQDEQRCEHKTLNEKLDKLMEIYPMMKESMEFKQSTDKVLGRMTKNVKVLAIWTGLIATMVGLYIAIRNLIRGY